MNGIYYGDTDPLETREWQEAFVALVESVGAERGRFLLGRLYDIADRLNIAPARLNTDYINTLSTAEEPPMSGDMHMERRIRSLIRWNALAMVLRANKGDANLGGHLATFASSATLYDVGFNYFFRAPKGEFLGDLIYYQGHASPGIYARSFLEGRLTEQQLDHFRREVGGQGLSSYPHPWLMPDYWQFPTVSMGLGPIQAIYQAHFMKHLQNRAMIPNDDRKVWAFLGDGEMDEPESLGALALAGRERLDNLIFVVNCNLQRLDGPVRGNGKIIQELEALFRGAGWNVIKLIWGGRWDPLLEQDHTGALRKRMEECVDGEYQAYKKHGGAYTREYFFGKYSETQALVAELTDHTIQNLNRGGHDPHKVHAAYYHAVRHQGQPTVILAKTIKGYGLGEGESENKTHQMKKLGLDSLKQFRDRFDLPFTDDQLVQVPYYRPDENSSEIWYLKQRREALGGYLPARRQQSKPLAVQSEQPFDEIEQGSGDREISTTMALVRLLDNLLKDQQIGELLVPIVPDEARTFGMEGLFRKLGIYSTEGQLYKPEDAGQVLYYREDKKGRVLEEGINEAGAMSAWIAAATAYSAHNQPMIPFYFYYSMFGFQRTGDLAWAAGDCRARGFLIGATSGRTTLNGEGLQHQDGHSHVLAATIPNCESYDPCYAYELAVIVKDGLHRMLSEQEDIYYYITVMNENYLQPPKPSNPNIDQAILRGMYLLKPSKQEAQVRLLGSGVILREVEAAQQLLWNDFGIDVEVWSVTSFTVLAREGMKQEDHALAIFDINDVIQPWISQCLNQSSAPVIASTDYMRLYAEQIRPYISAPYTVLGTDGFGRSDTRQRLRQFFGVDRYFVTVAAIKELVKQGVLERDALVKAQHQYTDYLTHYQWRTHAQASASSSSIKNETKGD